MLNEYKIIGALNFFGVFKEIHKISIQFTQQPKTKQNVKRKVLTFFFWSGLDQSYQISHKCELTIVIICYQLLVRILIRHG